jgi:lipopolysaccharide export LptBFGC system permease protein LptF
MTVCAGMFLLQEGLLPQSNRIQNRLRAQIRGDAKYISTPTGRQWSMSPDQQHIYTYTYDEQNRRLTNPAVYEFDDEGVHIVNLVIGETGIWAEPGTLVISEAKAFIRGNGGIKTTKLDYTIKVQEENFKPMLNTPAEMSFKQLSAYLRRLRLAGDLPPSPLLVALELKRSTPVAPLVLASIGIPLAFAFGKRNAIIALCIAIVIGVSFWGSISGFYIMGIKGILPPPVSAWSPTVVFGAIGIYLFTRART